MAVNFEQGSKLSIESNFAFFSSEKKKKRKERRWTGGKIINDAFPRNNSFRGRYIRVRVHDTLSRIGENVLETETNDQFEMKTFPIGNNFEYALIFDTITWKKQNKKKGRDEDGEESGGKINK